MSLEVFCFLFWGIPVNVNMYLRIAFHFGSPRLHKQTHRTELYDILRNVRVYTTEGISSELHLSQGGRSHIHVKERSELHIRFQDSQLEIFVPRNKRKQAFCYSSKLNSRLLEWLMTDPDTNIPEELEKEALLTIQKLLTCTGSVLRDILEEDGIRTGDIHDLGDIEDSEDDESDSIGAEDEGELEDEEGREQDEQDNSVELSAVRPIRSTLQFDREESSSGHQGVPAGRRSLGPEEIIDSTPRSTTSPRPQLLDQRDPEHLDLTRRSQSGEMPRPSSIRDSERLVPEIATPSYKDLLQRIVVAARRARFPHKDLFNMSSILTVLQGVSNAETDSNYVRLPDWTQSSVAPTFEHLKKIGAAGELYVSSTHSHHPRQFKIPRTIN